ncbi:MAG: Octanoyltransferase [Pseudomonadota bacterium]|jgi:lipoate-protein ligase B
MKPVLEVRRHAAHAPWTYEALDRYQRQVLAQLIEDPLETPGRILISELAPVITMGRRPCAQDVLLSEEELQRQGVSLYRTDRGGRATYHGPGQWVIFVVDHLERLTGDRRGVRRAVEGLLETACSLGRAHLGETVQIRGGDATGVWTSQGKLASVGVQIQHGVLLHGLALNVFQTPQSFQGIRPCGLDALADFLFSEASDERFEALPAQLEAELRGRFWQS